MQLQILSDCYLGLDEAMPIVFTVNPASELPEYAPHPEDKDLDNEPTLFEQVMAANLDESSDEEDDDEEEDDKKTISNGPTVSKTQAAIKKGGAVVVEDVEDSEEEDN
jgi:translocation protein SEC63